MYLKSLTLRGFKSFASATTLRFEPGITCVVGPNGSGKSNVVDALAWVMGEQGAKSLRGGKMEDVIFAGTSGRPPLGRAEVALTIDNTDGALPIDYTEVTISRTMFRNGGSEYAINGTPCRLLDVQELLSDSGIGREMHVIVGQGQLDAVLRATPEERRGFIEEAAGVLKHRKRKEKALRKLDAMQANLTRLTDLTAELRRQLKPLGRQAEVARRAAVIQADAPRRAAAAARRRPGPGSRARSSRRSPTRPRCARAAPRSRRRWPAAAAARPRSSRRPQAARRRAGRARRRRWYRLSSLRERLHRHRLPGRRAGPRLLTEDEPDGGGLAVTPRSSSAQAAAVARAGGRRCWPQVAEADGRALAAAVRPAAQAESAHAAEERRVAAAAARRGRPARGPGPAGRSGRRAPQPGRGRRGRARPAAPERGGRGAARAAAGRARVRGRLESQVAGPSTQGEEGLDAEHESAAADLERPRPTSSAARGRA